MLREHLQECLDRIDAREAEVRAFAWFDAARARRLAVDIERNKPGDAPLRGVPVAIKDIIDVAGLPTGMGSPLFADNIAAESADVVARLERAGALILGKTVTAELAYFSPGPTRNPHDLAHTPGGSSSGSAASVAAGFAPVAIGTQTVGSIIRPAAFCGVVGFKPSRGRISTRGVLSWSPTLDHVGVFARSVGNCAAVTACVTSGTPPAPAYHPAPPESPRLAAVRSPVWQLAEAHQREAFERSLATLRRAGAQIADLELPAAFAKAPEVLWPIMGREAFSVLGDLQRRHRGQLSAKLNDMLDRAASVGESEYREALAHRAELQASLAGVLAGVDAILTPPATGEAPSIDTTGDPAFCLIWTLCGVPAISVPAGRGPSGLPLGLQIVGRFDADEDLLDVAAWCESHL